LRNSSRLGDLVLNKSSITGSIVLEELFIISLKLLFKTFSRLLDSDAYRGLEKIKTKKSWKINFKKEFILISTVELKESSTE
jgi:hypothetical protein